MDECCTRNALWQDDGVGTLILLHSYSHKTNYFVHTSFPPFVIVLPFHSQSLKIYLEIPTTNANSNIYTNISARMYYINRLYSLNKIEIGCEIEFSMKFDLTFVLFNCDAT